MGVKMNMAFGDRVSTVYPLPNNADYPGPRVFVGDGVTTQCDIAIYPQGNIILKNVGGTISTMVLTTEYTISGNTLSFVTAPAVGTTIHNMVVPAFYRNGTLLATPADYTFSAPNITLAQTTNPAVNQPVATNGGKGDGVTTAFTVTPSGTTPTLTALYKTDWQGKQLLYSTARTNLLSNSLFVGGGAAPTNWTQLVGTGTSAPVTSLVGSPGTAYLQTATAQQPWFYENPAVSANTTYTLSCVVESVSGGLTAINTIAVAGIPAGANFSYPVCPANPSGGSAGVVQTGVLLLQVVVAGTAGNCVCRFGIGAQGSNVTGTLQFSSPQFEVGTTRTGFIATPAGASATTTDYTLVGNTATLSPAPAVGSTITWDGTYLGGLDFGSVLAWDGSTLDRN